MKDENPGLIVEYVVPTDLGKVSNGTHRRWERVYVRSRRRAIRQLVKVISQGYESKIYDPFPCRMSLHTAKRLRRAATKVSNNKERPVQQQTFK